MICKTMDCRVVETAFGSVPVWRRGHGRPVLVIRGAFGAPDQLLSIDLPGVEFNFVHLPGHNTKHFADKSLAAFSSAFDEVMKGRDYIALGASTGALVALGLKRPTAIVAVEPFLSTVDLWIWREYLERLTLPPQMAEWCQSIYGFPSLNRDYRHILAAQRAPIWAVVGSEPLLPRRPMADFPSLVSDADRMTLAAAPNVTSVTAAGGHNVPLNDPQTILSALSQALAVNAEALPAGQ